MFISRMRRVTAEIRIRSVRMGIATIKIAGINKTQYAKISTETVGEEIITTEMTAEMTAVNNAYYMDIRNSGTVGRGVFSILTTSISIQTKQRTFLTSKSMDPTCFTEKSTKPDCKSMGTGIITVKGADSKDCSRGCSGGRGYQGGC